MAAASPASGSSRWASTTSRSAGSRRSTTRTASCSRVLRLDFAAHGVDLPIYWGNRNWDPYLTRHARPDGAPTASSGPCASFTSAYSSYSGCRQYRENLYDATVAVREGAPRLDRVRHYFNHPGFVAPFVDGTVGALTQLGHEGYDTAATRLVFVTHSIPDAMNEASGRVTTGEALVGGAAYVREHRDVAAQVADAVADRTGVARAHDLVYCSRSGSPQRAVARAGRQRPPRGAGSAGGRPRSSLVPIGFVSDHMEVIYDLDTEAQGDRRAARAAASRGCRPRASTGGSSPMMRELLLERAADERGEDPAQPVVGELPPSCERVSRRAAASTSRDPERPALLGEDR